MIKSPDFVGSRHIAISEVDLNRLLARPPRGPRAGQLARYREADLALLPELERIMLENWMSATAAALQLAEAQKVAGRGGDHSRAMRLAKVFRNARIR